MDFSLQNNQYLKTAQKAIVTAGKYLKNNFYKTHKAAKKDFHEITVKEDVGAEKIILDVLLKKFSAHQFYSEEAGYLGNKNSKYLWIIDPLDGTSNYSLNVPVFCTQLALIKENTPIISIIFQPMLDFLMWAVKDQGAFLNNKIIKVNQNNNINQSIIAIDRGTEAKHYQWFGKLIPKLMNKIRTFRAYGSSGISLFLVAQGKIEGFIDYGSKIYDLAPGALMIKEAGGKITDEKNNPWHLKSNYLLASNNKIHNQLLKLLKLNT